jgi:hypothetical protein
MQTIIYHEVKKGVPCPDGMMAAAVAHAYYRSKSISTIFLGASYRKEYPKLPDFEVEGDVTIVDFSYPLNWLKHWEGEGRSVLVIEHHADKFPWLSGFTGAILDEKECGATLAFRHFFPDRAMPEILKEVRRRDIGADGYYRGEIPTSEAINLGLGKYRQALVKEFGFVGAIDALSNLILDEKHLSEDLRIAGEPEIKERDRLIALRIPLAEMRKLDGQSVIFYDFTNDCAIAKHYSMLGSRLCRAYLQARFCWMVDGDNNHLRAIDPDIHCGEIAKQQNPNGGGHPGAAGWRS